MLGSWNVESSDGARYGRLRSARRLTFGRLLLDKSFDNNGKSKELGENILRAKMLSYP